MEEEEEEEEEEDGDNYDNEEDGEQAGGDGGNGGGGGMAAGGDWRQLERALRDAQDEAVALLVAGGSIASACESSTNPADTSPAAAAAAASASMAVASAALQEPAGGLDETVSMLALAVAALKSPAATAAPTGNAGGGGPASLPRTLTGEPAGIPALSPPQSADASSPSGGALSPGGDGSGDQGCPTQLSPPSGRGGFAFSPPSVDLTSSPSATASPGPGPFVFGVRAPEDAEGGRVFVFGAGTSTPPP